MRLAWLRLGEFFRAFQRKHLIRLLLLVLAIIALFWFATNAMGRRSGRLENVFGTMETAFATSQKTIGYASVTVRLENGSKVSVDLPYMTSFVSEAKVELAVTSYDTGFGQRYRYKFVRFAENPGAVAQ